MIQNQKLRVSIVIPVYNEADHLDACLRAIAAQTTMPYEVIVVDNNSTDDTVAVAVRYAFITLIKEPHQGVVHARKRGFDAAQGDIIGRIDGDTLLPSDWVRTLQTIFDDKNIDAISGAITYYDFPYPRLGNRVDLYFREQIAKGMGQEVFLYGANMAIRRSSWHKTRQTLCLIGGLHEDYDLAIHAEEAGAKVVFDKRLQAAVSLRRFDTTLRDFWQYVWLNPQTYALHGRKSQRHMYHVVFLLVIFYWPIKLLYRGYDKETLGFSWHKLLATATPARVNPATYVD